MLVYVIMSLCVIVLCTPTLCHHAVYHSNLFSDGMIAEQFCFKLYIILSNMYIFCEPELKEQVSDDGLTTVASLLYASKSTILTYSKAGFMHILIVL